jgi:hypothetical protein
MIEDAEGDAAFLRELGVTYVGVEGLSLGGAQAMNFANAVADQEGLTMEFVVLNQTFTSAPEVCQNFIKNQTGSAWLGRVAHDFARRSILSETPDPASHGCDGLDNRQKIKKLILSQEKFKETKFYFFGVTSDMFMGETRAKVAIPDTNFSIDLYNTAVSALGNEAETKRRLHLDIRPGTHGRPVDEERIK